MKIAVCGLWHLGTVTAACLASAGHDVVGLDEDPALIDQLSTAVLPVAEPGLADLTSTQLAAGRLRFSHDFAQTADVDVVWIAYDTPVDEADRADTAFVHTRALRAITAMRPGTVLLVSSQMPVGSVARLAAAASRPDIHYACSPENLRLGKSINVFMQPDRFVIGVRDQATREILTAVFAPITNRLEWMSIESAEMTKHAINAFLATSICFINEIATLCERSGADALEVERGLKSEQRIGPQSYLHAGGAFSGGTLARDIAFLRALGEQSGIGIPLVEGVFASNEYHKTWLPRCIAGVFPTLVGRRVTVLGLTYKPGTDTLRRSAAVEAAQWLHLQGADVHAYDPQVHSLPPGLATQITLHASLPSALADAETMVVMTPWPEFRLMDPALAPTVVFDAARFLEPVLLGQPRLRYFSIGRAL